MILCIVFVVILASAEAFSVLPASIASPRTRKSAIISTSTRFLAGMDDKDDDDKLKQLGYSPQELQRSKKNKDDIDDIDVKVNLIPDIDAVTLTAVGFALIALNFFVFANLGDGGIAGTIATITNLARQ